MRKSIIAAVAGSALLISGSALADGVAIGGSVALVCEITNLDTNQDFGSMAAGASISDPFELQCNDADGATLELGSAEGGMRSDDNTSTTIDYVADISKGGTSILSHTASGGTLDQSSTTTINFTPMAEAHMLTATLLSSADEAGGYSDTIFVNLTAL